MWESWGVALVVFTAGLCHGQENIVLTPGPTQYVAEGFTGNVTFQCNVTSPAGNPRMATAVWVINGLQIVSAQQVQQLQPFGVFIENIEQTMAIISLDSAARTMLEGLKLQCAESIPGPPPLVLSSPLLAIITYGRPEMPYPPASVQGFDPSVLRWGIPGNLTDAAPVAYNVTASSSSLGITRTYQVNTTELSLQALENDALTGPSDCQEFNFSVVASLPDVPDSEPALSTDIIPNSVNVGPINSSLRVFSLTFTMSGVDVGVSFQESNVCSRNMPVTAYRVVIDGVRRESFTAPAAGSPVSQVVAIALDMDRQFTVAIEACSSVVCRTSNSTNLNTSDVQTAQVVFFENNVYLSCLFANGSVARGCAFVFEANLNATDAPTSTEEFKVIRIGHLGSQCNSSSNQRNGYIRFSVFDLEQNGIDLGAILIPVQESVLDTEEEYTQLTGCVVMRDVVVDTTAVAIAVPIILIFFLAVLGVGSFLYYYFYFRQHKKYKRIKLRKPRMEAVAGEPDELVLEIASENADIIREPIPAGIKPYESLHPSTLVQPDGSVRRERPPVEVELHEDKIRLRVNKTALQAVARFHMLVKKQHSEASVAGTLSQLDKVSMMALSGRTPSRVHLSKDLCDKLTPDFVKEVEEEEEGLRSWAVFHYDPPADVSPPDSMTTSPIQKIPSAWEDHMPDEPLHSSK